MLLELTEISRLFILFLFYQYDFVVGLLEGFMIKGDRKFNFTAVIHLQFWVYESWDLLFPISMSQTANL